MSRLTIRLDDETARLVREAARTVNGTKSAVRRVSPFHPGAMQLAPDFNTPLEAYAWENLVGIDRFSVMAIQALRLLRSSCLFAAVHLSPIPRTWQYMSAWCTVGLLSLLRPIP
jgi:hypothetical protein